MKKKLQWAATLISASCFFAAAAQTAGIVTAADFQARNIRVSPSKVLPYRLFVPKNYQASKKYPLMLTLHGAGERGTDDTLQLHHDFNKMWAADSIQTAHPCFVVAPQCPLDNKWVDVDWTKGSYGMDTVPISDELQAAMNILDSLGREFSLDPDRIYVSGESMGGYGTWYALAKFPGRFAAAVPVCGGGDPKKASVISAIPIWAFQAADDNTVPISASRDMVNALQAINGNIKYTEYPASKGYGHLSWIPAGQDPNMWRWVFQQARASASIRPKSMRASAIAGQGEYTNFGPLVDALGKAYPSSAPRFSGTVGFVAARR